MQGWRSNTTVAVGAAAVVGYRVWRVETHAACSPITVQLSAPAHRAPPRLQPSGGLTSPRILKCSDKEPDAWPEHPHLPTGVAPSEMCDRKVEANNALIGFVVFCVLPAWQVSMYTAVSLVVGLAGEPDAGASSSPLFAWILDCFGLFGAAGSCVLTPFIVRSRYALWPTMVRKKRVINNAPYVCH